MFLVMTHTGLPLIVLHFDTCLSVTDFGFNPSSIVMILLYLFLIRVFFYNCIPSMLFRMSIGLLIALTVIISKLIIFYFERSLYDIAKFLFIP